MKYVLINAFPWSRANGVTSYVRNLLDFLRAEGVETACISNPGYLRRADYQRFVRDAIVSQFRPDEVIVEAPELKAPTLLLPHEYSVHVRLHCPNAIVEKLNEQPVNWQEFAEEMDVVRRARVASSPSYALLRALEGHLGDRPIHVYKNPGPQILPVGARATSKIRDVMFLGRFSRLKGTDYLDPLLRRLPAGISVALAGKGSDEYLIPPEARCRVTLHGEMIGPDRLRMIAESRVALILSRFENCSMTILESLAMGTVIAGWHVGGNPEIAAPRCMRLVRLGDTDALAATILDLSREPYPEAAEFHAATGSVEQDFRDGWRHVFEEAQKGAPVRLFRGLNCAGSLPCPTTEAAL